MKSNFLIKSDGELGNVYVTRFYVKDNTKPVGIKGLTQTQQRIDRYVRWGWFEDNILSQYSTFSSENSDELISTFRSIEPEITDDGQIPSYRSVLIRNNPSYLMPKDAFAFFLPGQNVRFESIDTAGMPVADDNGKSKSLNRDQIPFGSLKGYALDENGENFMKQFLTINSNEKLQFADPANDKYGRLRNIMINVKQIQMAFGITPDEIQETLSGNVYGSDVVNPPSNMRAGVKNLLDALSENFHNFWRFEIVEDNFTKNVKIIETNSTAGINSKRYTKFGTDENPNTNRVNSLGIYKFPSFTLGSMVKNQDLSFSIPDAQSVSVMYGSNKNKTKGLTFDGTNEGSNVEALFKKSEGSQYLDKKLKGMDKAYKKEITKGSGHKIGNLTADPNTRITKDGGLQINPNDRRWHKWSQSKGDKAGVTTGDAVGGEADKISSLIDKSKNKFSEELEFIISEISQQDRDNNAAVEEEIKQYKLKNPEPKQEDLFYSDDGIPIRNSGDGAGDAQKLKNEWDEGLAKIKSRLKQTTPSMRYYQFVDDPLDDKSSFTLKLFDAGETIVRTKLFQYDNKSSAYQTDFLIPAELGLTIDGISGITPGDVIQTDYIQPTYNGEVFSDLTDPESNRGPHTFFQIFGLTQNLNSEGWTTEITTKMRMNSDVLELEAGEIKFVPEIKREVPPAVERPKIPVPSEEEDIADDLPLDEDFFKNAFDDFSKMDGPPPPPPPTLIDTNVEVIFGCMDDRPAKPSSAGYSDVYGKNRFGDNWAGDDVEILRNGGYLAQNYDPEAQIDGVSETDLTSPCTYDEEVPQQDETPDFDFNLDLDFDDEPIVTTVFGCSDPNASNYAGSGFEDQVSSGEMVIIQLESSPCIYPNVPSGEEDPVGDLELDDDLFSDDFLTADSEAVKKATSEQPPPKKPPEPIKILDTKKVPEQERLKKKPKKKSIPKKKLEQKVITDDTKKAQELTGAVVDPIVTEGITRGACTDEQIALGYQTVVGYIAGVDDGLNVNNPQIYGKFVEGVGGGGVSDQFCDARDPKPPKPKIEEKQPVEKVPPSAPPPKKLKSTYFGGYAQNYKILYKVTPWYTRGDNPDTVDINENPKNTQFYNEPKTGSVPYYIRQKFWDERIEAPNETGISAYSSKQQEFSDASVKKADEFVSTTWQYERYEKGQYVSGTGSGADRLPPKARWDILTGISCARKAVNGIAGAPNLKAKNKPGDVGYDVSKPTDLSPKKPIGRGYAYSSDGSKQGDKILFADYGAINID